MTNFKEELRSTEPAVNHMHVVAGALLFCVVPVVVHISVTVGGILMIALIIATTFYITRPSHAFKRVTWVTRLWLNLSTVHWYHLVLWVLRKI